MQLLYEWNPGVEPLHEATSAGNILYLEGPMIMTEQKNRNGRIYKKQMMEKSVDKYITEFVNEHRAIGELNHPTRPFADPKEAAIKIESLKWDGNNVLGKARVLNNPNGQIIKSLVEANFKLGMSTRGLGELVEKQGTKYVENYMLNAIDAVDMPSGQVCYMNALRESVEWINEGGVWVEKANQEKALALFMEKFEDLIKNLKRGK
jgi:hypothetical protein